jgi:hypothetical protein
LQGNHLSVLTLLLDPHYTPKLVLTEHDKNLLQSVVHNFLPQDQERLKELLSNKGVRIAPLIFYIKNHPKQDTPKLR